jgi:ubiquinone/menaquinone biosynthesis C-methylase UbiE
MDTVNYDNVAEGYNLRYQRSYQADGLLKKLHDIAVISKSKRVLEVGCGTGHWLNSFPNDTTIIGLDASFGMLKEARTQKHRYALVQGTSSPLPFRNHTFDFIFCINAIHHFDQPIKFIQDCNNILVPGGIIAIVCMNPHSGTDKWFIYDYFKGTYQMDLSRYPAPEKIKDWLRTAGFKNIQFQIAERLQNKFVGEGVFPIPKDFTSQLSLLSDHDYRVGIQKIKDSIALTNSRNQKNRIYS